MQGQALPSHGSGPSNTTVHARFRCTILLRMHMTLGFCSEAPGGHESSDAKLKAHCTQRLTSVPGHDPLSHGFVASATLRMRTQGAPYCACLCSCLFILRPDGTLSVRGVATG